MIGTECAQPNRRHQDTDSPGRITVTYVHPFWPRSLNRSASPRSNSLRSRPFAVEVTLVLDDWGQIVRVIEVPA